ncbi:hypothetical protein C8Q80DRAFT_1271545 [Daedaleopsis nitida]|nr:hypothetical protein C8Q80DRAFT_1271545 [Daedaleopsis nitida]
MSDLTPSACAMLNDLNDFHVLFASPVVKIESLKPAPFDQLHGFAIEQTAVVTDGHSLAELTLPVGLRIFGCVEHFDPTRRLQVDDTIKLERMARLRVPRGNVANDHVIFVHDIELLSVGDDVNLMVSELAGEAESQQTALTAYQELEEKLKKAEDGLKKLLEPKLGPVLLDSVVTIIENLDAAVDRSMVDQQGAW